MISQLGRDQSTRLWAELAGDLAPWTLQVRLLAEIVNASREMAWLQTEDATKKRPKHRPERILPPDAKTESGHRLGTAHMTLDETREWLGW